MKTLGEVFDSQFGINLPQQISQGELTQLNINKQARLITLAVKFNGLVERNTLFDNNDKEPIKPGDEVIVPPASWQENMTEEDKSGMVSPSAPVPVEAPKPVMIPMEP